MKLRELGEDRLIAQLVARLRSRPDVAAGAGDDCAVLKGPGKDRLLLFKTDCVVEGVHFQPGEKPAAVGWKAMARTLSDFAAMSGLPHFALVTLIAPPDREARWVKGIYRGLERVADRSRESMKVARCALDQSQPAPIQARLVTGAPYCRL